MRISKQRPGISKQRLGRCYLVGTGCLLTGVLLVEGIRLLTATRAGVAIDLLSGTVPAASLASIHYWLDRLRLDDEQVWRVAVWGGAGIGLLTLLDTGIVLVHHLVRPVLNQGLILLISNVAVGGVAGVCIGGLWEVNENARALHEKNAVLNRVMRHNIRNEVQVIQGQVDLLEDRVGATPQTEAITEKIDDVIRTSERIRRLQATIEADTTTPERIDLVRVVEDTVEGFRRRSPEVEIDTELPVTAWVAADEGIERVLDNLVENAIEHADDRPSVHVAVSANEATGEVELLVEDDGPGIPDAELDVLFGGAETSLSHSNGLGLWLAKWFVESYHGTLTIDADQTPRAGTTVRITLPRASRPSAGDRVLTP